MAPAKGRRRMNAAERRCLRQALALDHRPGAIEPPLLLAQMRHGRLGQRIEGAPAALAAEPQKAIRTAPTNDLAPGAMGAALGLHTLMAGRSKRVLTTARAFTAFETNLRRERLFERSPRRRGPHRQCGPAVVLGRPSALYLAENRQPDPHGVGTRRSLRCC